MASFGVQSNIDIESFQSKHVQSEYPCFVFTEGNDPLVVVYNNLVEGDIPLIFDTGSVRKTFPKKISGSAYNVQRLLQVLDVLYYYNERGEEFEIRDVIDYLEAVIV